MAPGAGDADSGPRLYSATYSNSPVYELFVGKDNVMRRRVDDWINATHILKVADLDKPARTRVLEKEVQQDIHEKVQGGYGKYQGTWVPLNRAKTLAEKYNVFDLLRPLFDYQPGDTSPPPAPKHTTAASNKPKAPKAAPARKAAPAPVPRRVEPRYDDFGDHTQEIYTPDQSTIDSPSIIDEDEYISGNRKRRREPDNYAIQKDELEHQEWSDQLLDYFMLRSEESGMDGVAFPEMPTNAKIDRPIDNEGHTALHWACAMGDIDVAKYLLDRKASVDARNIRGETPLIRAALFSNCLDKQTWTQMVVTLKSTITMHDHHGGTVFHHIGYTAHSGSRSRRAFYYFKILLDKFQQWTSPAEFHNFLNTQDTNGDTAFHIVARNSSKCRKLFLGYNISSIIRNANNETVDDYLYQKTNSRSHLDAANLPLTSSPVQGENPFIVNNNSSPSKFPVTGLFNSSKPLRSTSSQTFQRGLNSLISTNVIALIENNESLIAEKEDAINNLLRTEQRLRSELSTLRTKNLANAAILEESEDQGHLEMTLFGLRTTAERLEEQTQHRALHLLVRQEENSLQTLQAKGFKDKSEERRSKAHLAHLLAEQINKRVSLAKQTVVATADAGMSEQGATLKTMVVNLLGMPSDRLVDSIDEILEHVRQDKAQDVMDTTP